MAQLIILRGYPGSGKTTVGRMLEKQGYGRFIDHNAILDFVAEICGDDDGIYDDIANLEKAMTRKLLQSGHIVIVARGFSSPSSIEPYVHIAQTLEIPAKVVRLHVDHDELAKRVQSPERKEGFNPTTDLKNLSKWIKENPILDYPNEIRVNNIQPIDEIVKLIIARTSTVN